MSHDTLFSDTLLGHRRLSLVACISRCFCRLAPVALVCGLLCSGACASQAPQSAGRVASEQDPWEPVNRAVFRFNDALDRWVARPTAKAYRFVAPAFVERGVGNFFSNLDHLGSSLNQLLQGKPKAAGYDAGRFALNSLAGLGGLVDVASAAGLEKRELEDFGQTLEVWGLGPGPYVMLPILGPSTLTSALALPLDYLANPVSNPYMNELHDRERYGLTALSLIDTRASLLDSEGLVTGDKYLFYREAYLQNHAFKVKDGEVTDDFGGDLDDF